MKFNKFHDIPQFRDVIRSVSFKAAFTGLDGDGNPLYDYSLPKPSILFIGTVKLHGTNAGVIYTPENGINGLKRSSLLSRNQLEEHFEFNRYVNVTAKETLTELMEQLWLDNNCVDGQQITIFGEWAGLGIQKSVGISELPKAFYVFGAKIRTIENDADVWLDISKWSVSHIPSTYNIFEFPTYEVMVDFNLPALSQNKFIEITEAVEKDCPVARQLLGESYQNSLVGEGVVWTAFYKGEKLVFKVKGEKHSTSKVKTLAAVDPELVTSIQDFVDYACTVNRLEQGIMEVNATERHHMPELLRWVANDIIKEENDVLLTNALEWKDVSRECSNRVRQYYFAKLDNL